MATDNMYENLVKFVHLVSKIFVGVYADRQTGEIFCTCYIVILLPRVIF